MENSPPPDAAPSDTSLPASTSSAPRSDTCRAAARALERGEVSEADMLLQKLDPDAASTRLLRARLLTRQGEEAHALRELEAARRAAPDDGGVYATAAEIYASLGRRSAADEEIRRGLARCGPTAELERAQGLAFLAREGGGLTALVHLERAREMDPGLPFLERALAAAYELGGRAHLAAGTPLEAIRCARAGLELEPEHPDLKKLLADGYLGAGLLRLATATFEELYEAGEPVDHDLALSAWRAGMAELLGGSRADAVAYWLRARELGMSDEALGTAARILRETSTERVEAGMELYQKGDYEAARDLFAEAVHLDPDSLAAENHLAVTHFQLEALHLAIEGWERVLRVLEERAMAPPEPVHLNLVKAWVALERFDQARHVLAEYDSLEEGEVLETEADFGRAVDRRYAAWLQARADASDAAEPAEPAELRRAGAGG